MVEACSIQRLLMENAPAASTVPGNEGPTLNKTNGNPPWLEQNRTWGPIRKHGECSRETHEARYHNVRSGRTKWQQAKWEPATGEATQMQRGGWTDIQTESTAQTIRQGRTEAGMLAEPWGFSSLALLCYYHKTLLLLISYVNESFWPFCMFLCGDFIDSTLPTCFFCPSHSFPPPLLAYFFFPNSPSSTFRSYLCLCACFQI